MGVAENTYLFRNKPAEVTSPRDLLVLHAIAYRGDDRGACNDLPGAQWASNYSLRTFSKALDALIAAGAVERHGDGSVIILALRARRERPGFVYAMECEGRYKLGASRNVGQRATTLQTGLPAPLRIVWTAEASDMFASERALHTMFAHRRIAGEWYALTPEDLQWIAGYQPE